MHPDDWTGVDGDLGIFGLNVSGALKSTVSAPFQPVKALFSKGKKKGGGGAPPPGGLVPPPPARGAGRGGLKPLHWGLIAGGVVGLGILVAVLLKKRSTPSAANFYAFMPRRKYR